MSLWRPIMCRTSQMFPPPPRSDPTTPYVTNSSDHPAMPSSTGTQHLNNNNNTKTGSKCDPSTPSSILGPTSNSEFYFDSQIFFCYFNSQTHADDELERLFRDQQSVGKKKKTLIKWRQRVFFFARVPPIPRSTHRIDVFLDSRAAARALRNPRSGKFKQKRDPSHLIGISPSNPSATEIFFNYLQAASRQDVGAHIICGSQQLRQSVSKKM